MYSRVGPGRSVDHGEDHVARDVGGILGVESDGVDGDGGRATGPGPWAAGIGLAGTAATDAVYQGTEGDGGGDGDSGDHAGGFHDVLFGEEEDGIALCGLRG